MAYDLEEQEQLATIKSWWAQYGNAVTWLLTGVLVVYCAWSGWSYYQRNQAAQSATLFEALQREIASKSSDKVWRIATDLEQGFGKTVYAQIGALSVAKYALDNKELAMAKQHLVWASQHGDSNLFNGLAKIRLAGVYLDEKAFDDALKTLSGDMPKEYAGLAADRKGDVLSAQKKFADAKSSYEAAMRAMDAQDPARQMIQVKLNLVAVNNQK